MSEAICSACGGPGLGEPEARKHPNAREGDTFLPCSSCSGDGYVTLTDPGSRALDAPVLSAERRALEIAVQALRRVGDGEFGKGRSCDLTFQGRAAARRALRDIAALVPDAGEPGQ